MKKSFASIFVFSLSVFMLVFFSSLPGISGQSASKLAKMGDQAVSKGSYYSGALAYLESLEKSPKSTKTRQKLADVALRAYTQKLNLAEEYRNSGNLDGALREYKELEEFVEKLRKYNAIDFATVDFSRVLSEVSEGAAETRYKNAESYFAGQEYDRAIEEYRGALKLKSPYKDCLEKISESYYRIAAQAETRGAYRMAAENYLKACSATANYKDAKTKSVSIYYALGNHFLNSGYYRNAYEDFLKASTVDSQFSDLANKLALAKDLATTRIAFTRFENTTEKNVAGIALADVITEGIKSKVLARAGQFIRVLDREELYALAQEQRISEGQINSEMSTPLKLEGVDYLVFGKLNQVRDIRSGPTVERLSAPYEYSVEVPYTDSQGRQKTRTKWYEAPMYFDLIKDGFTMFLGGSVKVISVKTGSVAINMPISEEGGDQIVYATNIRLSTPHTLDSVILDRDVAQLINARREIVDIGEIINKMILSISDAVSSSIVLALDKAPQASDPTFLKY